MIKKSPSIPDDWWQRKTYREAVCPVCKTKFVSKYRGKKEGWTVYCSSQCRNDLKRRGEFRNCEICEKKFYIARAHVEYAEDYTPGRFCSRKCYETWRSTLRGPETANWRGGRFLGANGYVYVRHNNRYELEHRLVMEQHLGRKLRDDEVVHHINEDKTDNRIENLQLMTNKGHIKLHAELRKARQCG